MERERREMGRNRRVREERGDGSGEREGKIKEGCEIKWNSGKREIKESVRRQRKEIKE